MKFRKAAAELRMGTDVEAGRRLRRLVMARERELGVKIAQRGRGQRRPVRGVTMAAVARYLPELLPAGMAPAASPQDAAARFRTYLAEIDDRLRGVAREEAESAIQETVRPQLEELRSVDNETREMIADLAQRVASVAGSRKAS